MSVITVCEHMQGASVAHQKLKSISAQEVFRILKLSAYYQDVIPKKDSFNQALILFELRLR